MEPPYLSCAFASVGLHGTQSRAAPDGAAEHGLRELAACVGGCAFGGLFIPRLRKTSDVQHVRRSCLVAMEEAPGLRGAGPAGAGSCLPWGTGHSIPRPPTGRHEVLVVEVRGGCGARKNHICKGESPGE